MFKKAERKQAAAGDKFGRLTLLEPVGLVGGRPGWECICDCGSVATIQLRRLVSGHTKSCGCIQKEGNATKHGNKRRSSVTPTYVSWCAMNQRCNDPGREGFPGYGGSGITVCERWKSFAAFLEDMGERPDGMTIDRIDGTIGYQPGNCRWATSIEQANNKRTNRTYRVGDTGRTLKEWSEISGIPASCIHKRINKLGWPVEAAISTPSRGSRHVQESRA